MDHDGWIEEPIAENFDALLKQIIADPAGFLVERGCYTRYSDEETDTQWIPEEYIADCDKSQEIRR